MTSVISTHSLPDANGVYITGDQLCFDPVIVGSNPTQRSPHNDGGVDPPVEGLRISNDTTQYYELLYDKTFNDCPEGYTVQYESLEVKGGFYPAASANLYPFGIVPTPGVDTSYTIPVIGVTIPLNWPSSLLGVPPYIEQPLTASNPTDTLSFNIFECNANLSVIIDRGNTFSATRHTDDVMYPATTVLPFSTSSVVPYSPWNTQTQENSGWTPEIQDRVPTTFIPLLDKFFTLSARMFSISPKYPPPYPNNTVPDTPTLEHFDKKFWTSDISFLGAPTPTFHFKIPLNYKCVMDVDFGDQVIANGRILFTCFTEGPGYDPLESSTYGFTSNYFMNMKYLLRWRYVPI